MNMDDFLRLGGTDIPSVVASVDEIVGLDADDVLFAVGSLVEGLGTSKSDLDLLLITPHGERSLPSEENIGLVVGRRIVDLRILQSAVIKELLARLYSWSQLPWSVTNAAKFTHDERLLLHRLLHGRILHKDDGEHAAMLRPLQMDLARLKLHVARHMARTIQVDMVGYRDGGDYPSLVFAAQELLGHAVDALLAGYQLTSPASKWRSRLLDSIPSDWEGALTIRPTGLTAGQMFWRLHRAPEQPEERLSLEYTLRIITFARAVFTWAELQLVEISVAKQELNIWPQIEHQPHDFTLPYLELDVDFFLTEEGVKVARLNEFVEPLEMSAREFALVLLFDGTTSAREAEIAVYGSCSDDAESRNVDRLVSQAVRAGLSLSLKGESE